MPNSVVPVSSHADLLATCGGHKGLTVVLVWAQWHEPSVHIKRVFEEMAKQNKAAQFASVNVDVCMNLATKLGANQVPFTAFLSASGDLLDSFGGPDPPKLMEKVKALSANPTRDYGSIGRGLELNARLDQLLKVDRVMLFMKGNKQEQFCGFSKQVVAILNKYPVEYSTFNILDDEEVRQGLKKYKDWNTYPQLYVNGELIGGLDIIKEMDEDGSIADTLPSSENKRLKGLIEKKPVMLFMKGNPEAPKCGFSRKMCESLQELGVDFDSFDILSDEDVRQGLKAYANWQTYPQLYAQGKLIGGIDIIKELAEDGTLKEELGVA